MRLAPVTASARNRPSLTLRHGGEYRTHQELRRPAIISTRKARYPCKERAPSVSRALGEQDGGEMRARARAGDA